MTDTKTIPSRLRHKAKEDKSQNRTVLLAFRVTEDECKAIDERARKLGHKRSEYCRDIILRHKVIDKSPEELKFRRTLMNACNNLSFIVKNVRNLRGYSLTMNEAVRLDQVVDYFIDLVGGRRKK